MSEISFDPKLEGVASGALRRAAASCLFIAASLAFAISISLSFDDAISRPHNANPLSPVPLRREIGALQPVLPKPAGKCQG
jgi:hypothetical protein